MTACNWAGVNRSKMPSGSKRTGRKRPNTPGSRRVGEDLARNGITIGRGDPARTVARMRRQRTHHEPVMPKDPQAQTPQRISGSGFAAGGAGANKREETGRAVNGWLTAFITTNTLDWVASGAVRQATSLPSAMSTESGMTNLHEAASHTQCRTRV